MEEEKSSWREPTPEMKRMWNSNGFESIQKHLMRYDSPEIDNVI